MPNPVRIAMVLYSIAYTIKFGPNTLLRSLTPDFLFGGGPSDPSWTAPKQVLGDGEAKQEARDMMKNFAPSGKFGEEMPSIVSSTTLPAPFN
jgi:hypothetical protein